MTDVYRHKKRGTKYIINSDDVRVQCETPLQDGEKVLLYHDIVTGKYSVRRASEFHDGRFEKVNPR